MSRRRAPGRPPRRSDGRGFEPPRLRASAPPRRRARLRGVEILLPASIAASISSSSGSTSHRAPRFRAAGPAEQGLGFVSTSFAASFAAAAAPANPRRSAPAASRRRRRLRAAAWVLAPGDWRASSRARRLRYPARRRPEPRARRTGAARTRFVSSPRPGARNRRRRRRASRACRRRTRRRDARTRSPVSPGPRASSRRAGEAPRRRRRRRAPSRPGTARGALSGISAATRAVSGGISGRPSGTSTETSPRAWAARAWAPSRVLRPPRPRRRRCCPRRRGGETPRGRGRAPRRACARDPCVGTRHLSEPRRAVDRWVALRSYRVSPAPRVRSPRSPYRAST